MKVTKILIAMLASAFIVTACDPIEDEDLRDKYVTDAGTPITKEALQAAISITQPFPNQDGVVYNPQIQISAESETKRSIFREKDKTKRSKKESAQHSKSRNKSFVMTSVSAL